MDLDRQLYSWNKPCPMGCSYCFAKWPNYTGQPAIDYLWNCPSNSIIYPCCDSDMADGAEISERLLNIAKKSPRMYVSISVKRMPELDSLESLNTLNRYLKDTNKGFVKIGISLTTKYRLEEIEPGTDSFFQRKELFLELQRRGFETSIVLKPILPFIPDSEYFEIIEDFPSCSYFLLGDLYIQEETNFYNKYINGRYDLINKEISWLDSHPVWKCIDQAERIQHIARHIADLGKEPFNCDIDLIARIAEKDKEKRE